MPKDLVASRSLASAKPAAARSSASSHDAGLSLPSSLTSGSVNRTCLLIERTFPGIFQQYAELNLGYQNRSTGLQGSQPGPARSHQTGMNSLLAPAMTGDPW